MERAARLIAKLKLPKDTVTPEDLLRAAWPIAVGKRLAAHTRFHSFTRNRLVIEVEDAIWQSQLRTLRSQILGRLGDVLGVTMAVELEFRVGVPRREPQRATRARQAPPDEADSIQDPVLRSIYKSNRKKAMA